MCVLVVAILLPTFEVVPSNRVSQDAEYLTNMMMEAGLKGPAFRGEANRVPRLVTRDAADTQIIDGCCIAYLHWCTCC